MKQALFILAAFLLLAPSILMGQDFEVVNAPGGELKVSTFLSDANVRDIQFDTTVRVQNKTLSPVSITLSVTGSWKLDTIQTVLLPPSGIVDLPISLHRQITLGKFKGNLSITSSSTTKDIMLKYEIFPHIMADGNLNQDYVDAKAIPGIANCMPIKATNNTAQPMHIYKYDLDDAGKTSLLTVDTLIPPSYVILPGESVVLLNICYVPKEPNKQLSEFYYVQYS